VSRTPGASPTSGKLTVTGPAGDNTVTLSAPVSPLRVAAPVTATAKPSLKTKTKTKPKTRTHHKRPLRKSHH
jgi:hypothetical protein